MMHVWNNRQRGSALVTVLMIVAAMSAVAFALTQAVLNATGRARSLDTQAQANWYSHAAEAVAHLTLGRLVAQTQGRLFDGASGLGEPVVFPVDGGTISIVAQDATNCFNLNGLVARQTGSQWTGQADAIADYHTLLQASGISGFENAVLVDSLVDWMDSDSQPGLSGAEDAFYASLRPGYRTSGQRLHEIDELRAVRGYTPEILQRLRPIICARKDDEVFRLNLNTLTPDQAPLLILAMSGQPDLDTALGVILSRPTGGWPDAESFQSEPGIARIDPDLRRLEQAGFESTHMQVLTRVAYRGRSETRRLQFRTTAGTPVEILTRQRET